MHPFLTIRRAAIGVGLIGAALAVVPGAAQAASSCTFDEATKTMTVTANGGSEPLVLRNASTLTFTDGSGGGARTCFAPKTFQPATAFNTTKIRVKAAVPAASQHIVIDESTNGRFVTTTGQRMFFTILTGTGNDHLTAKMGSAFDAVSVRTGSGLALGPEMDLNVDGTPDLAMTAAGLVTVDGGGSSDFLDATGSNTFQVELLGGVSGNDTLRGGGLVDFLDGGDGNDTIKSKGDNKKDFVVGGFGDDRAITDSIDSVSGVERREL